MTVKQLIDELSRLNPSLPVYVDVTYQGSEYTGTWQDREDAVVYDMESYVKIGS